MLSSLLLWNMTVDADGSADAADADADNDDTAAITKLSSLEFLLRLMRPGVDTVLFGLLLLMPTTERRIML